jgi:two-component system chemotaxis response regulator CheY
MEKPLTVLVVDDSATMRAMIRRAVTLSGVAIAAIHEAGDGAAALAQLESHPCDVIFTDINMPGMNGVDLLRAIAARGWTHLIRIVVSTDGSLVRRKEMSALGVQLMVDKPFAPEAIRDVLTIAR